MDLDKTFAPEQTQVDLSTLVPNREPTLPQSTIRNRASTTALLSSSPENLVDNYQLMVKEGGEGQDNVTSQLIKGVVEDTQKADMQGLMSVLSDPKVSYEDKRQFVTSVKTDHLLRDSPTVLYTNSLAADSEGENVEQEAARLSSADAIREIYDTRTQIQGLVNAHGATLDPASIKTVGDMAALWVLPFGNSISVGKVGKAVTEAEGRIPSLWDTVKGFLLPGTKTQDMRERLASLPPEKRVEYAKALIKGIKSNSGIIFSNDNQFAQFEKASSIFEDGGYSDTQEFLDNISPIFDIIGLGQLLRAPSKAPKLARAGTDVAEVVHPAEWELVDDRPRVGPDKQIPNGQPRLNVPDQVKRIEYNSVVRQENPAAPANIVQQSNPAKARNIHEIVVNNPTDEAAQALYGTDKGQAIVNDLFPQATTAGGAVTDKVFDIERNLRRKLQISDELVDLVENTGATYYTRAEKAQARAAIVNDFGSVSGLTMNEAMSSFSVDGGKINIGAVYGTADGAWLRAEDAFQQAKYSLRSRGILDDEIQVLQKQGLDYVPVALKDVQGKEGSYLIRVNSKHEIDVTDISNFERFDVKRNLFDRVGPTVTQSGGSLSRYVFDAASMLHPIYTGAASVASDATARFDRFMLSLASEYSDQYMKFDSARKAKLDDYIREANFNGVAFDHADLVARGFSGDEISALKSWRHFWDAHFYLENADLVRTMNAQGYQLFRNKTTELYVKPITKNQSITRLYDPATDSVISVSKTEMDNLYNSGGTFAKLRRPANFNGDVAEYMIVRNTPSEYTRPFRDVDQVLNYREGYFQIQYKAPKFVEELTRDATGNITGTRTIAVAGDTKEAEFFAQRMKSAHGGEYRVRGDIRALYRDSDAWWDVNSASGRISQRHRGKLLEDASGLNHLGDGSYVLNPVDSAVRAAKSIGGRTVTRPMLEAAKARFINQYSDVLPLNNMGGRRWPRNVAEITAKGADTSKQVADARTTYEYINYLENGYINSLDNVFKWGLNTIADMAGRQGLAKTERAANWIGEGAPASLAKNAVFMAYIGTNPLRQWIIQPHQIIRTFSYNPTGWATGSIERLTGGYLANKMDIGYKSSKEVEAFTKFLDESGLLDAVDKQNLVRGTLMAAADNSNPVLRNTKKYTTTLVRQIGFDIGEMGNLLGHAAAVYDRQTRLGKNLADKTVRDEAYSEIRAISYDMNFAGDMPYNQTSPSLILQFMQVPHKAFLQATNRRIEPAVRMRMLASDILMWGGPTLLISKMVGDSFLPDDPKSREALVWGLESYMLNNMFSVLSHEDVNIDFSSLAPYDTTGWSKFFAAMYDGGVSQMITNSPAGQFFLKEGGRAQNAIKSMARYFGIIDEPDEPPETFLQVMDEVAKMSSGYSNAVKAKLLLDARKRYDQYGNTIDKSVSHVEAWAQLFGFGTADTRDLYRMSQEMSTDVTKHREEVLRMYNDIKRYYTDRLETGAENPEFITKVTGRVLKVFEDDPKALGIIASQWAKDSQGKDARLMSLFMQRAEIPTLGNLKDQVKQMPVSEEDKQRMMQIIKDVENIRLQKKKD